MKSEKELKKRDGQLKRIKDREEFLQIEKYK